MAKVVNLKVSETEINAAKKLASLFKTDHVGKEEAITSKDLLKFLSKNGLYNPTDVTVRKLVSYIRTNGLVKNLIATTSGYYIETNKAAVRIYVQSLKNRANAILAIANSYNV